MRQRILVAALVVVGLCNATPAAADEVTGERFSELVDDALGDPNALDDLRDVTAVDGQAVDTDSLLVGDDDEVRARLELLDDSEVSAPRSSDRARDDASEILGDPRFDEPSDLPRPLQGLLDWVGDRLEDVFSPIVRAVTEAGSALVRIVPGGTVTLSVLLAGPVLVLLIAVVKRSARRRSRIDFERKAILDARLRPSDLEREAEQAERSGDLQRALRLRFSAGLLRLEERGLINTARFVTSSEVARRLASREFDTVARTFDEVVYGGRAVRPEDLAATRATFGRLLAGSGRS